MKNIFLTYFPVYTDIHLYKDPGQIPFRFKKVFDYDSYIITNSEVSQIEETKKYVKILQLPNSRFMRYVKLLVFFYKNRGSIKVFNIFHIEFHSLFVAWLCKLIVPHVFIYLKMDNCIYTGPYPWEKIFDKNIQPAKYFINKKIKLKDKIKNIILKNYLIHKIDLFSIEDYNSKDYYESRYPFFKGKIITVYNGHVLDLLGVNIGDNNNFKDNIILNVARLGTYQKATEILLEAFAKIASENKWELHLAGNVDESFNPFLKKYFMKFPELKNRIYFHGQLNKIELIKLYQKSKIFCLPSRYEGFAIVFSEAMFFKNAIITTKYVSPREIIKDSMGIIIERDNVEELASALRLLINNPKKIEKYGEEAHRFASKFLNWDEIIKNLFNEMKKLGLKC